MPTFSNPARSRPRRVTGALGASGHGAMARVSSARLAQGSLALLFLVLLRTLGEYYRLRAALGAEAGMRAFSPYVSGLVLGVAGTGVAVGCYVAGRPRAVVGAAVLTVAVLFIYKVLAIP